jgi:ribosomal protein S18 acetylase RimI-like enzyme
MHIRPTTLADLPDCVTIHDAAFKDNELTNFLAPNRFKYYSSWRQSALSTQRKRFYQPNAWSFVCVADAHDDFANEGDILGVVRWSRHTSKEEAPTDARIRKLSLPERIESLLSWAEVKWEDTIRINPAWSWSNRDAFMQSIITSTGFAPLRGETYWYLDSLAVGPEYQRCGIGRKLVELGLQHAEMETEERVAAGKKPLCAGLTATAPALHLYRSLGFKVVGWEDDSFMDVEADGGSSMVWDPTGYWIRPIVDHSDIRRGVVEAAWTTRDVKDD